MTTYGAGRLHRAVGIETEYGVTVVQGSESQDPLSVEDAVREMFAPAEKARSGRHRFTTAGARLYVDIGNHPEYAGPECVTVSDVVAQDLAGDALLEEMARCANDRLAERGARLHVLKSNTDAWGATFGCHENYQVARSPEIPLNGLVGLLAARQVLTGAGALPPLDAPTTREDQDGQRALGPMLYSARASHIHGATSADPTHERAFVNTRDEPHADASRWRRLHVVAGDSAMSPWTTALKVTVLDAALLLAERGQWDLSECQLTDPAGATHAWNTDPSTPCARAGGLSPVSCPDLLDLVLDRLESVSSLPDHEPDALRTQVLDLARRGTQALRTGDSSTVDTELDWAIKHRVLSRVAQRSPGGWSSAQVRRAELAYHDLSPVTGLRSSLSGAGLIRPLVSPGQVERARTQAPEGTRALLRGRVVEACERTGRFASVSWSHVRLDAPPQSQIDLPDPLVSQSQEVEDLLGLIEDLGPL